MPHLLPYFIWIPLGGFLLSLFLPAKGERFIAALAIGTVAIQLLAVTAYIVYWMAGDYLVIDNKYFTFYKGEHIEIFLDYFFDKVTAVYAFTGALLTLLVSVFSKYYLHRDEGYKRFFSTLLLFFLGYNLVIFSGNFETLFIGWEILGICSFLLIAFYRDRYLPVKNALKVISVYRLGDICLILAMWMSHQLWHSNITFYSLLDGGNVQAHLAEHGWYAVFIAFMIFVAAAIKSAQAPFSSWLPRAMEGPTTSSAIFYGSLSVHLGVFLLMRTYPYWESIGIIKILVIVLGFSTSIIASSIARVQSTVKTQIAYSSVTQIGLMFVEVALGWHVLALVHFAGNAFLRTYQLLVSPSVLSYLVHDMVFQFKTRELPLHRGFRNRLRNTFYMLSVKEWNMDRGLQRALWDPFKWIGRRFRFFGGIPALVVILLLFVLGLFSLLSKDTIPASVYNYLPWVFSGCALVLVLSAFTERRSALAAWLYLVAAQVMLTLSIALSNTAFHFDGIIIYLSGALLCGIVGFYCLQRIRGLEQEVNLESFQGHAYEHRGLAFVFLLACLGLVGLPFTPTFIGIDILFSNIRKGEILLIAFTAACFVFMELSVLRIYARIFMGQHKKSYHPIAYRSS